MKSERSDRLFEMKQQKMKYSAIPVCAAATFAAVQEGYFIRSGKA